MMRNCIILGSGRSGTSMASGVLSKSKYFMGEHLNPGNETNPKGQFEDREINNINEELLALVTPRRPSNIIGKFFYKNRPSFGQRWLARIPVKITIPSPIYIEERIKTLTNRSPFCFKDPRFSYTLPVWRPFIKNVAFICIFRHPGVVVTSILRQSKKVAHLRHFSINENQAFQVWELMYLHILKNHYPKGENWLFIHYNQFFDGSAFNRLENILGVKVNQDFPESYLSRSKQRDTVPPRLLSLYRELCELARYQE